MAAPDLIIGLGHRKRVGKDAFAEFLDEALSSMGRRVWRLGFALRMKGAAHHLFGDLGLQPGWYYDSHPAEREMPLPKLGKTPRQIWIEYGNAMRAIFPDIWVNQWKTFANGLCAFDSAPTVYIIPDVRFPNEAKAVKSWGGLLFKIERPGVPVDNDGADDALDEYDGWDGIIHNDAGLGELSAEASRLAQWIDAKVRLDRPSTPFTGDR